MKSLAPLSLILATLAAPAMAAARADFGPRDFDSFTVDVVDLQERDDPASDDMRLEGSFTLSSGRELEPRAEGVELTIHGVGGCGAFHTMIKAGSLFLAEDRANGWTRERFQYRVTSKGSPGRVSGRIHGLAQGSFCGCGHLHNRDCRDDAP